MKYKLIKAEDLPSPPNTLVKSDRGKSMSVFPNEYVVLDIETTGLNPKFNEIIELSALKVVSGKIESQFTSLVKPKGSISPFITGLTGINHSMVAGAPDIKEAIKEFSDFCEGNVILGHNINFDIRFINEKLRKYHNRSFDNYCIDTLRIARILLPQLKNRKLGTIAEHFGLNTDGMHRGLKDCTVTNLCFQRLKELAIIKYGSLDKFPA